MSDLLIDIRLLRYAKSLNIDVSSAEMKAHLQRETESPGSTLSTAAAISIYGGSSHRRRDGGDMWVPPGKAISTHLNGQYELIDMDQQ